MNNLFLSSSIIGVVLSIFSYYVGIYLNKKLKTPLANPLLIAIIISIAFLLIFKIDYRSYEISGKYLSYLITPATVALAIPLYKNIQLLKENIKAISISLFLGTFVGLTTIFILSKIFNLSHGEYVTLLPKSITTPVGMQISKELGGMVTITVAAIIITGILGNILAIPIFKMLRIKSEISKGLALGAAAHVIGTSKALEYSEVAGAMGSLAIVVCSIITVVGASIFSNFV